MVILNDIHIDIMDYITPADCSLLQFRCMWAEFEWENKVLHPALTRPISQNSNPDTLKPTPQDVHAQPPNPNQVAVNTSITDPVKYLRHIVACTNMKCLTHIDDDTGAAQTLQLLSKPIIRPFCPLISPLPLTCVDPLRNPLNDHPSTSMSAPGSLSPNKTQETAVS